VGEAPGADEDKAGKNFRGSLGTLLRDSLQAVGQRLEDCGQTYAMICRPPEGRSFTDVNINACRPALLTTIDRLKPKVVVLLGSAPVRSLIPAERGGSVGALEKWLGFTIPSLQHRAWLCPTYSLLSLARSGEDPTMLKLFQEHLRKAFSLVGKEPRAYSMKELWAKVETITSPREARLRLKKLAKQEGVVAFDYEANAIRPDRDEARLWAASFCLNGEDTFSFKIENEETLRAISPVLRSPRLRKIAHNVKNEERWTRAKLGHPVVNWDWDPMIAAHVIDNRQGITGLKFQVFLYFGIPDYNKFVTPFFETGKNGFNRIHEVDTKDLLNYNGVDSLVTYMVAEEQKRVLGYA
jgi:uracil-DNA glycosylase family 4